jgi:hypothetical protein
VVCVGKGMLSVLLDEPSVYDAFLQFLARRGLDIPECYSATCASPGSYNRR